MSAAAPFASLFIIGNPHTVAVEDFPDTFLYRFVVLLDSGYIVQTASKTVTFSYLGKHILGLNFIEQVDERIVPFQHCRGLVCHSKHLPLLHALAIWLRLLPSRISSLRILICSW